MRVIEDGFDKVEAMKKTYKKLKLDCLVVLGGNGSLKSANMLAQEGLNVIGLPKTIDNDTWGTDYTFGFQSAVDIATNYLNEIETTAKSHSRVFVVEIMGHKVGHICLQAGIAAGVDAILLPEIPYDIKVVAKKIKENQKTGKEIFFLCLLHYNDTCKENQQFTGGEHRVVKLNILNMENFLDTVNACIVKVYMLCPNGKKQNINGEEKIQGSLWRQYSQNKNCLRLVLEVPNPTDYMNIVSYYAGDC